MRTAAPELGRLDVSPQQSGLISGGNSSGSFKCPTADSEAASSSQAASKASVSSLAAQKKQTKKIC